MADFSKTYDILSEYIKARVPFVILQSEEKERSIAALRYASDMLQMQFTAHSAMRGLYNLTTQKAINDKAGIVAIAFDAIAESLRKRQNQVFILTDVPDIGDENDTTRNLLDLVSCAREANSTIVIISEKTVYDRLQKSGMSVRLDTPNKQEMLTIIKNCVAPNARTLRIEWSDNDFIDAAASLVGLSQVEAENIIATYCAKGSLTKADLDKLRFTKDDKFNDIAGLEKIRVKAEDLQAGGLEGLKKWLNQKRKFLSPEMRSRLDDCHLPFPRGILLVGVPGCGKSLMAKRISAEWSLPLYRLDLATVYGKYIGQSENQMHQALITAESVAPCVLWIDEIEKGLSQGNPEFDNATTSKVFGQFLYWLQECKKDVFVVATANDISRLPAELLRHGRFDQIFFVDLPTAKERTQIISIYVKKHLEKFLNYNNISMEQFNKSKLMQELVQITEGYAPADIEAAVKELTYQMLERSLLNDYSLKEQEFRDIFSRIDPISKTAPEKINAIRQWGIDHDAMPASGEPIDASLSRQSKPMNSDPIANGMPANRPFLYGND